MGVFVAYMLVLRERRWKRLVKYGTATVGEMACRNTVIPMGTGRMDLFAWLLGFFGSFYRIRSSGSLHSDWVLMHPGESLFITGDYVVEGIAQSAVTRGCSGI